MGRGRTGRLIRYLLATFVLITGASPPVHFGHTHAHHGEHTHFLGTSDDDHDDADHHSDGVGIEEGSFHWHDGLVLLSGPLTTSETGQPLRVGPGDVSSAWCDETSTPLVSILDAFLPFPAYISWHPPPAGDEALFPAERQPDILPMTLVGSVLIRC